MGAVGYVSGVDAAAVGADPEGTAAAAVAAHTAAPDPHGDREYTDDEIDEAEAGLVPASRSITAGTGLTGGGTLASDRTLAVTYGSSAGTAAQGNDSRLSDARTPLAHQHSGADITSGTVPVAQLPTGTSGSTVALGNHTHAASTFAAPSYQPGFSNAGGSLYTAGTSVDANNRVLGRGRILASGNYTAGTAIATLDASAWPAQAVSIPTRSIGVGAGAGFLEITTAGVLSYTSSITAGAGTGWTLDGLTYYRGAN